SYGEDKEIERKAHEGVREVVDYLAKRLLGTRDPVARNRIDNSDILGHAPVILEPLERGRKQVKLGKRISHAARKHLLALEIAAQESNGPVSGQRKILRIAMQLAIPALEFVLDRGRGKPPEGEIVPE